MVRRTFIALMASNASSMFLISIYSVECGRRSWSTISSLPALVLMEVRAGMVVLDPLRLRLASLASYRHDLSVSTTHRGWDHDLNCARLTGAAVQTLLACAARAICKHTAASGQSPNLLIGDLTS